MIRIIFPKVFLFLLLLGCQRKETDRLAIFDISREALVQAGSLGEFPGQPEYLPLETVDTAILSGVISYLPTTDCIWVIDIYSARLLAFDRQEGRFLRQIGVKGRGPGEYGYLMDAFFDMPAGKIFCKDYGGALMQYDISGRFDRKIPIPFHNGGFENCCLAGAYTFLNDTVWCCYYMNIDGREKKRLALFSPEGKVYRVYPNFNLVPDVKGINFTAKNALFYTYNGDTFFKEAGVDTVFQVTMEALQPRYVIHCGEYSLSYAEKYNMKKERATVSQRALWETDRFIYYLFLWGGPEGDRDRALTGTYLAVYDKNNLTQNFYRVDGIEEKAAGVDFKSGAVKNMLKFTTQGISSGYLFGSISAMDIREYFGNTVFPEAWKNVKEEDNPVLVLWKLP